MSDDEPGREMRPERDAAIRAMLVEQVCAGTGGPCTYTGKDMKTAHAGMAITDEQFNARFPPLYIQSLVENAMKHGIFAQRSGSALAVTHEMNPAKPMSETIAVLHDRTVEEVVRSMDAALVEPTNDDELVLLDSGVMNHALRKHVLVNGAAGSIWRVQ